MEALGQQEWDKKRLEDIPQRIGHHISLKVLNCLSHKLRECPCTDTLAPYLLKRRIITEDDYQKLTKPKATATVRAGYLVEALTKASTNPVSGTVLTESLYLALMDKYESDIDEWCRATAVMELRPAVLKETKIPEANYQDLRKAVQRMPVVQLSEDTASRLKRSFGLSHGHQRNLTEIVQKWLSERNSHTLSELVSILILTPAVGKYVCYLLPHFLCNPAEVYRYMRCFKAQWKAFASFQGYTGKEIAAIEAMGGKDTYAEIKLFLRMWWVPDCGEKKEMMDTLQQVMVAIMNPDTSPQVTEKQGEGQALLEACMRNDWTRCEALIKEGNYLEACSEERRTPLMFACLKRQERVAELLIANGADVQHLDKEGNCCLHFPETLRNFKILECLLRAYKEKKFSVDLESAADRCTPLAKAVMIGAVRSAELLLDYGASPNCSQKASCQPLVEACAQGHTGLVRLLLKGGADLDITDQSGMTPLLRACNSRQWGVAQVLINEGASVNRCGPDGTSPLFAALESGTYGIIAELIAKGANVNAVRVTRGRSDSALEETPLTHATARGMTAIVELLLSNGANINTLMGVGNRLKGTMPAIGYAIIKKQTKTFHTLLSHPDLDRSLLGLSTPIITAIKTEGHYFTDMLLKELGGLEVAFQKARHNKMSLLADHLTTYMHTTKFTSVGEPQGMASAQALALPKPPQPQLEDEVLKVEEVLHHFCQICTSALLDCQTISHDALVEIAKATSPSLAAVFRRVLNHSERPEDLKPDFLAGDPSPLSYLIENKILTDEMFQVEVLKYYHEGADDFYRDLIWTFHQMPGGEDLPYDVRAVLTQMFNGHFVPNVERRNEEVSYFPEHQELQTEPSKHASGAGIIRSSNSEAKTGALHMYECHKKHLAKLNEIGELVSTLISKLAVGYKLDQLNLQPPTTRTEQPTTEPSPVATAAESSPTSQPSSDKGVPINTPSEKEFKSTDGGSGVCQHLTNIVTPTGNKLGFGSYGDVVEVECRGKKYAAKKYRYGNISVLKPFGREIEILMEIKHRNIVSYFGICSLGKDGPAVLVMEKLDVNLSTFLEQGPISLPRKFSILHDVACGLTHLHTHKPAIIHRDLTATNVLLDSEHTAKIADFGNSRMVDLSATPDLMTSNPGTLDYMPPEALEGNQYDEKIDVFSYGHLAIHIIIQHRPHPLRRPVFIEGGERIARSEIERRVKYMNETTRLLKENHPFILIIKRCLQDDPNDRPRIRDFVDQLKQ